VAIGFSDQAYSKKNIGLDVARLSAFLFLFEQPFTSSWPGGTEEGMANIFGEDGPPAEVEQLGPDEEIQVWASLPCVAGVAKVTVRLIRSLAAAGPRRPGPHQRGH